MPALALNRGALAVLQWAHATDEDNSPISAGDAKRLFADWKAAPALVLAVSGGPIRSR